MIEVYKYLHGLYHVEEVPLLLVEIRVTRGHSRRLKKERVETRQRRNHFRHRTVNRWNSLTEEVVSAPSLNSFKEALYRIWCGVNRLGDSGVDRLSDTSAFVNTAGQLLLTRRGETRMDGVGIVYEFYTAPL